ncbi:MAG: hypothetical protein NZ558_11160, partial [Blastocatellia bacterium]|nr:hypothetical protein [Blastocatellia bacterium]
MGRRRDGLKIKGEELAYLSQELGSGVREEMILRGYEVGVVEVRVVYGVGGMGLYVGLGVRGRDV